MATLNAVSVTPNSVALGATATVTVGVTTDSGAAGRPVTITVGVDGQTGTGTVVVGARTAEVVTYSTNPADVGRTGYCVATCTEGTLVSRGGGVFLYTAPAV